MVAELFSQEVHHALFATHMLEMHLDTHLIHPNLWSSYLRYLLFAERKSLKFGLGIIRRTAELICEENGITSDGRAVWDCMEKLCLLAYRLPHCDWDDEAKAQEISDETGDCFRHHLLAAAAYLNCVPLVRRLHQDELDPLQWNGFFKFPMAAAASQENNEIVAILLDANRRHSTDAFQRVRAVAIQHAIDHGHLSTFKLAIDPRWGEPFPPEERHDHWTLHHWKLFTTLSESLSGKSCQILEHALAIPTCRGEGLNEIIRAGPFLAKAAERGYVETCRRLLSMGAPINGIKCTQLHYDYNPLAMACIKGHLEVCTMLLENGADPEFDPQILNYAVRSGNLRIVNLLFDRGARIDRLSPDDISLLIALAIGSEHPDLFHLLRSHGASLDSQDTIDWAFEVAVGQGLESTIALLLREGVKPDGNALSEATRKGHDEIARLLHLGSPESMERVCETES
jgi:ankyrin repeat protein